MTRLDFDRDCVAISSCRICGSSDLQEILDLGVQPLANALKDINTNDVEKKFPLILLRCAGCTAIQLSVNVNPKLMFQEYLWVTGTTPTAKSHCQILAKNIIDRSLVENPKILEIGSNDGTLLMELRKLSDGQLFGIDPAQNIADGISDDSLNIKAAFFDEDFADKFYQEYGFVDVIVARNVLSHVPDLNNVMAGVNKILSPNGIFVVEFHEASRILNEVHYDSIYHEHTFYHSIRSMSEAQAKIEMHPFDLLASPISGGSFVLFSSEKKLAQSTELLAALNQEEQSGVQSESVWLKFSELALENIEKNRAYLLDADKKIRGFGASARSSTLLNAIGTPAMVLAELADNNPLKWGKLSPGLDLPINSPALVIDNSVDTVFICPFNFEAEIVSYLKNELNWSGEVYLPLPGTPRIYSI